MKKLRGEPLKGEERVTNAKSNEMNEESLPPLALGCQYLSESSSHRVVSVEVDSSELGSEQEMNRKQGVQQQ